MDRQYWLMKSEPDVYGIDDLARDKTTYWDGVRNYQARNFMRDLMRVGDGVLYYHSNAEPSGIAGFAKVCKTAYLDHTAFDPQDKHYDPKSKLDRPVWYMVDVAFIAKCPRIISLSELKACRELSGMAVLQKGQRLSVMPVEKKHYEFISKLAGVTCV